MNNQIQILKTHHSKGLINSEEFISKLIDLLVRSEGVDFDIENLKKYL
jgi:hypothetical protein